ncbi:ATP-binding protein [Coleofasciculus sp. FACHB-1120]|uniref:hybrid sensor histidine kinase/response regulator n=1 Tax=Coleofasciculus sp. FACHB-1120 TaxID=2692783 RepID=UPI0018EFD263|nr:ATP-binding protein [Coleofasciculus sp. FACHB-1120]
MTTVPLPPNEIERLEALRRYNILDTPPEESFDRITALAARLFDVPIALVSLVDQFRAWFKSCYGFDTREINREATMCSFAILSKDVFVVADTRNDPRFACKPYAISEPGIRFYAGAPLIAKDGFNLGTLCLVDSKPRHELTVEQRATLADLAAMVVDELELRLAAHKIAQMDAALIEVTKGVSAATGEAFFYSLAQHLTKALDVDFALIGELAGKDEDKVSTIALYAQHEIADNIEYSLLNTPCKQVIRQRKLCCYPRDLQAQFPGNLLLAEMDVDSYIATPLLGSTGRVLGLVGVMARKPLENIQLAESLLTIFATRATAELERKRAEEERARLLASEQAARAEAEAANRMKDEFLAVLSHELRSPLNPIIGWSGMLRTQKLNPATTARALETIERNAKLQAELIEDLLDVSRMIRGKLSLNVCPVNLLPIVQAAMETVHLAAAAKSIRLESLLAPSVGLISGDPNRLQQIFWNLLSNAIKFTPSEGRVEIKLDCSDSYAQIEVSDTGKGIEADFLPYVFERFRQADSTSTRSQTGLGLGLAIVRHLTELHGGTVCVDSPGEGQGAIFTVKLPLMMKTELKGLKPEPEAPLSTQPSSGFSTVLEGLQVLVVDDEADSRDFLAIALEQYGARVTAVASVQEALLALQQVKPDVLVSDIGMPDEDGYTLIRKIRAMTPEQGGQISAVALTAYARSEDCERAILAGFQQHVTKPVEAAAFAATIASLARNSLNVVS